MFPITDSLVFSRTPETLDAIVSGLELSEGDHVLAICGSGDASFAMLRKSSFIKAVDWNPKQIEYATYRKALLISGDYPSFLGLNDMGDRYQRPRTERNIKYLLGINSDSPLPKFNGRNLSEFPGLAEINLNIENLEFAVGDIFEVGMKEGENYNKIYLSNAWNLLINKSIIEGFIHKLAVGTIIYTYGNFKAMVYGKGCAGLFDERLIIEPRLTELARDKEYFGEPVVYLTVK